MAQDPYPGVAQVTDRFAQQALRFVWDKIATIVGNTFGPTEGTLNPDQRPILTPTSMGFIYYATDYNRRYRWTGTAWTDDAGTPTRYQVAWFPQDAPPEPITGWARCDGSAVQASTATGATLRFSTPVIPTVSGLLAWIRL